MQKSKHPLPLGRQLWEARHRAGLSPKQLALKAGLSTTAIYHIERPHHGGRTRTLIRLAKALGLKLRIPDLAALAKARGLSEAKLALVAGVAFDTVHSMMLDPFCGNLRTLEKVCEVLHHPITLVI